MPQVATSQIGFPKFVEAAFHDGVLGPSSKPPSMSCSTETQPPLDELELAADEEDDELATEEDELLATDEEELLATDEDELAADEEATEEELATDDDELATDEEVVEVVEVVVVAVEVVDVVDELVEPTVTWRPVDVEPEESSPPAPPEPLRLLPFAHPNVARSAARPSER